MSTLDHVKYLYDLSRITNILSILHPYQLDLPESIIRLFTHPPGDLKSCRAYVQKAFSNNVPPVIACMVQIIPTENASQLADSDKSKTKTCSALRSTRVHDALKIASKISGCGQSHLVLESLKKVILIPYQCNNRLCPTCNSRKSVDRFLRAFRTLAKKTNPMLSRMNPRSAVLTIRNIPALLLREGLTSMLAAWKRLRDREQEWKNRVNGYIWNAEVTYNAKEDTWHPHIHLLWDGVYWPRQSFSERWSSYAAHRGLHADPKRSVWIRKAFVLDQLPNGKTYRRTDLRSPQDILHALLEVTKYQIKIPKTKDGTRFLELHLGLFQHRMFGSAGNLKILTDQKPPSTYQFVAGLDRVFSDPESPWQFDPEFRRDLVDAIFRDPAELPILIRKYDLVDLLVQADNQPEKETQS